MAIQPYGEIVEKLRRSTVLIHSRGRGSGSGVIWSSDGVIVTNAHVVRSSAPTVQLWDGREFTGSIASRDLRRDLAMLRIAAASLPSALAADPSSIHIGNVAIAIGNPMGFVGALTTGIIRAVGPVRGLGPQSWVQAALRLAPGNSGGPLADSSGYVIGINTMVAAGLALAVPSNEVTDFLAAGPVHAWLGVTVYPVKVPGTRGRSSKATTFGLVILEIEEGSPAAAASLLPGDILLGTEESSFLSPADLSAALGLKHAGVLRLEFLRGDYANIRRVTVQLDDSIGSRRPVAA